jgi:hypothetical protein
VGCAAAAAGRCAPAGALPIARMAAPRRGTHMGQSLMSVCVWCCCVCLSYSARRPNILFLQCDEMDGRVLDPAHPLSAVTHMPHLTRLAARGVSFVNSYCENPLCAPSRASTFTGRRTSNIRVWNNVKALTTLIDAPAVADPTCARIVGYGEEWCVAEGRKQNITSSIRHALVQLGYDVRLHGKMDTGGGVCRPEIGMATDPAPLSASPFSHRALLLPHTA